MPVGLDLISLKVNALHLSLVVLQQVPYFFHSNDTIDLAGSKFAEAVLATSTYDLLIHFELAPVAR